MIAYMLTENHAWIRVLNARIENLCQKWQSSLPEQEADERIDNLMEYCKCIRQKFIHRDNYHRVQAYIQAQLSD